MLKLKLQYFGPWCEELTHLKRPWCWERLKAGEGDDRGWEDDWMASPTQWTWVSVSSRSWWWTGKPGVLQSMGSQRVGHDWVTELNWSHHRGLWVHIHRLWDVAPSLFNPQETFLRMCRQGTLFHCFGRTQLLPLNLDCLSENKVWILLHLTNTRCLAQRPTVSYLTRTNKDWEKRKSSYLPNLKSDATIILLDKDHSVNCSSWLWINFIGNTIRNKESNHVWFFVTPWTIAHQDPHLWNSLGKNTGVSCHSLLQGISLTHGSNLGLLHCRLILYHLSHPGKPILETQLNLEGISSRMSEAPPKHQ